MIYTLAIFAPLAGALVSGLLGRAIGDRAAMGASVLGMVVAAICGPLAFFQLVVGGHEPGVISLAPWVEAGRFQALVEQFDFASRGRQCAHMLGYHQNCPAHHGNDRDAPADRDPL